MRNLLPTLRTTLIILLLLLYSALARAHDFEVNGIYYNKTGSNTVEVTYQGTSSDSYNEYTGSVTIPENVTYNGETYSVTRIGRAAFYGCSSLTSVTIPYAVTYIDNSAFYGCSSLTAVTIGNSVTIIGDKAFYGCKSLTAVTIPDAVIYIGCEAFRDCESLTSVTIPDAVTFFEYGVFRDCESLTAVTIGNSVTYIADEAFYGCKSLTEVTIPDAVTRIGKSAFSCCRKLSSVTIPDAVTYIGGDAFYGCQLQSIEIPSGVQSIGEGAFRKNSFSLNSIKVQSGNPNYDSRNDCNALIETSSNTLLIGCKNTVIPNTIIRIGGSAFYDCSGLTSINIPNSVTSIGGFAFHGCSGLTSITIPDAVTSIGDYAFYGCSGLTSITIPDAVTSIGNYAFSGCTGLKTVNYNAKSCGNFVSSNFHPFYNCPIEKIVIGDSVTTIPSYFAYNLTGLSAITIPDAVTSIGNYAFSGCTGLSAITIPDAVTSIGKYAFSGCTRLKTVNYNAKSCGNFGSGTFYNCPIDQIVIGDSVTTIPGYFAPKLTGLTTITIPDAVTSIGQNAFSGCTGLSDITIPDKVTSIGDYAFSGCTGLNTVISYAIEPPSLRYSAFNGVPNTMTVFVPPIAVDAYKSAYPWNWFEILPMSGVMSKLVVNLPENAEDYANMRLEISNAQDAKTQHYAVTDKTGYSFSVEKNTTWDVTLQNQYGDVFGKIENVQVGEADVNVTFSSLLKPQDVTLIVKTPTGQDVTSQCRIYWLDENGELLLQGNPIKRLPAGRKLQYQVTLLQELATAYSLPSNMAYTVKEGNNSIVCQLTAISKATLSGSVKDASNNQPLYGATISAVQSFDEDLTKTVTARTDNQGHYSLEASSVHTSLTVAASGYISQTVDCDMMGGSTVTVPDVSLSPITGTVVNVNLTYTPAHLEGEPAQLQNWYSDYNNVDYEVFNKTTGRAMTGVHMQYPQLVLTEDVNDGDVLEITATSRKDAFNPVKATATIAEQKATATFNILEKGKVSASFNKNINPQVVGTLYDANGKMVTLADYSGSALTLDNLADGSYKLVTMGKSEFFNDIYDLEQFASAGLQNGVDYVQSAVTVTNGLISPVTIGEVPYFDETKFYYTGEGTSFSVNKPDIVIGNYLTFRAQVDFKEQYRDKVTDVQVIVDLPESCQFFENSVMVGSNMGGYSIDGNRVIIPLADYNAAVRFCAIPTMSGDFNPSAFVQFRLNGKTITQPIGNAPFTAKGLSIEVPSITSSNTVLIHGTAFPRVNIEVYDNDVLVGQTVASGDGNWFYNYEIPDTSFNCTYHKIYAKVFKDDLTLFTEIKMLAYHSSAVYVRSVDMIFGPYNYNFNFDNPSTTGYSYTYPTCGSDFTFIVNFSNNDSDAVSNVKVNVLLMDNSIETLDAVYDSSKSRWIAHGMFTSSDRLPINLNVVFDGPLMIPFDDTNRRECENQNVQNSMQEIEDFVDSNIDVELIDDYEDHVSFMVNSPLTETQWVVSARAIDRNNVNLDDGFVFIPEESYYYKDNYSDDGHFTATIVDNDSAFAVEFYRRSSIGSNLPSCAPQWWNSAVNFVDVVSDFFIPYKSYVKGVIVYNFWVKERYPWYINAISQENEWTYDALDAKCKDGSYRITTEQRKYFFDKIQNYQKLENDFYNSVDALANLWSQRLRNAFYYEALTSCVGKAVKAIPHAQFFKSNGKGGGLMRYVVKGGLEKRNQAEGLIENVFDHFVQGIELVGDWTDFMDYESVSEAFQSYLNEGYDNFHYLYSSLRLEIRASYKKCDKKDDPKDDFPHPPLKPYIDPSGFVYEGVPSNRLQGVTATCYYKETVEDMYGDEHEEVVLWDAENYGQENPLLTDENGYYRWDVPVGLWQVKYEKEGYETTYSDWLPVPPPQLDVNIGMVQMRQPEVIKARAYPQAVELEFDKYMLPETLTTDNITVSVNGQAVSGTIELLNAEVDDPLAITSIRRAPGTGLTFASRVRFNAARPFNASEVTLHVKQDVKSYADLMMNGDYEAVLPVELEMQSIQADSTVNILYGDSRELTVTVSPAAASKGKTLTVRSVAPMIATTDAEAYTLNANGQAVITVHGDLPGMTSLVYTIDGYDLTASTLVKVMMESELTVALPTASIASGSEVERGTAVYLKCATPGATIYYTLDGSCPCDPSDARKVYDGSPIVIDRTVTIKAMAVADGLYDSDVATFIYRVRGLKGDVNRDGAVNIADVNLLIDYILRDRVTSDMLERGDVNGDGAINIGDINAVIQIILGGPSARKPVNTADLLHAGDLTLQPGQTGTLTVTLDHASRYSAMQCDIELPQGLTLVGVTASGQVETGVTGKNMARAVAYSMSRQPLATGDGQAVLTLTVHADAALASESRVALTGVVLADVQGTAWYAQGCTARVSNASGINDLQATGKQVARVRYYNVAGQEIPAPAGLTIQVTTYTDGSTVATRLMSH